MTKTVPFGLMALIAVAAATPASAQLGTSNNPPPQRLFDTGPSQQLDNGLGTMAERRAKLAQVKRGHRVVRR